MAVLSKSKLIAFRQCPKRLWLEVHRPEVREDSASTQATFAIGTQVGTVARALYDPKGTGSTIEVSEIGVAQAITRTRELIPKRKPIFEAGFSIGSSSHGALAFADVMLPMRDGVSWSMVEVKSSTEVKDYYKDDVAIQFHIATGAGVQVSKLQLACVDSKWTYEGGGNYAGLLKEQDVTGFVREQQGAVKKWLRDAQQIVGSDAAPSMEMGSHCNSPFACGFARHCRSEEEKRFGVVEFPLDWLPGRRKNVLKDFIEAEAPRSMNDVPDEFLSASQLRVKAQTLSRKRYFDAAGAARTLAEYALPAMFLDFETIALAVPVWPGTRPYEKLPFQFSLHTLRANGVLTHSGFLDLTGNDPSEPIAKALVRSCGTTEPIFAYHKSFEASCLETLALRLPTYARRLRAIAARLVDLEPVATRYYYHPDQQGSWSIKKVLPTIARELRYDLLEGVQDGGAAQVAYGEAVDPATNEMRREEIRNQLWRYCRLDTFAMVKLWALFAGRDQFSRIQDDCSSYDLRA